MNSLIWFYTGLGIWVTDIALVVKKGVKNNRENPYYNPVLFLKPSVSFINNQPVNGLSLTYSLDRKKMKTIN